MSNPLCPPYASFFGFAGASLAMSLCALGAAYGTAKTAAAVSFVGVKNPPKTMNALLPVIFSGILVIYGLIMALWISKSLSLRYTIGNGALHLAGGLSTGISAAASGMAIGNVAEHGVKAFGKESRVFTGLVLILIFAEMVGLLGFIGGFVITTMVGPESLCS